MSFDLLNTRQVLSLLGISEPALLFHKRRNQFPAPVHSFGREVFYIQGEVEDWRRKMRFEQPNKLKALADHAGA